MSRTSHQAARSVAAGMFTSIGSRQIRVIVATENIARDGDVLIIKGIDTSAFEQSGTVLFNHEPNAPVAKCLEIGVEGSRLMALVQFPPEGTSETADEVYRLIKAGVLNAISIGWMPLKVEPLKDAAGRQIGWKHTKSELLEFSIVSVPADADALIVERSGKASSGKTADHIRAIARHAGHISGKANALLDHLDTDSDDGDIGDRTIEAQRAAVLRALPLLAAGAPVAVAYGSLDQQHAWAQSESLRHELGL